MSSTKKSSLEKEKERLEALQNREKKFLTGMYGDFFGGRIDDLEQKGREVASRASSKVSGASSKADELMNRQKDISSRLNERTDALRRANDALREVQSLLDNPLYNGMPSLTGKGTGSASGSIAGAGSEIDPSLMAGSDGDLFTEFAGNTPGTAQAGFAPGRQETASAGQVKEEKKEPEKDPMEELDALIGLSKIKHDVKELADFVKIQKMRKDGGLKSVPVSLHLVFTGNPGTGKTTVARILARIYKQIGVLSTGQLVEVDRSGLVAGYVGQTAIKTSKKIEEAKGGILFIDEAYSLARKDDTFGQEAIDTILKAMEDNREDFVVIVAGYTGPMENFINSNPGLKSRFNKYIEFPDYTIDELMGIFDMNCKKYDYEADEEIRAQIRAMIVQRKLGALENYANARDVRNLFEEIITNQARRVAAMESPTQEDMKKILLEDLEETAEQDAQKAMEKAGKIEAAVKTQAEKNEAKESGPEAAEKNKPADAESAQDKS